MQNLRRQDFLSGAKHIFPLIVGAIPFGIIFGTLAVKNGLTVGQTMALSLIVFAGSAQFIAIGLFAVGASWQVILLTTFVVNLRHLLYSATLSPAVRHLPKPLKALMAFLLTDEAFAVTVGRYTGDPEPTPWFYLGAALLMYVNWQVCTLIGALFGNLIPGTAQWGLDFAMPVAFIGMLVPYLQSVSMSSAAVAAGIAALAAHSLPHNLGLVTAATLGIAAGFVIETLLYPSKQERITAE